MNPIAKTQWATACPFCIAEARKIFCKPLAISYPDEKWFTFFRKPFFIGYLLISGALFAQPADIKFDRFDHWPGYSRMAVNAIGQDAHGFLQLSTPSGNERFDGNIFELSTGPPPKEAFSNNQLTSTLTDRNGRTWLGAGASLSLKSHGYADRSYALPGGAGGARAVFFHPAVSGDSVVWVLADSALLCFHIAKGRFIRDYRNRSHDVQSLYGAPFRCAFLSREGILWLGGEGGLCKYDWRNQEFRLYDLNPGKLKGVGGANFVLGVEGDPRRCWTTSGDLGLQQYDLLDHRLLPEKITGELVQLARRNTYGLAYDKLGRLWVGNTSDSIFVCDVKQNKIVRRIPQNDQEIHFANMDQSRGWFWYLLNHENGKKGMIRIIPETVQMDTFWLPDWQDQPEGNRLVSWMPDKMGALWFLHGGKFIGRLNADPYRLEKKPLAEFSEIDLEKLDLEKIRYDPIRKLIWFSTKDDLLKTDWETGKVVAYHLREKKRKNKIVRIEVDDAGMVWVQCAPENLLYKFDPERETFACYDWSDGLLQNNTFTVWTNRPGGKWRQLHQGHSFILFDPLALAVVPANPPLITEVRINGRAQKYQPAHLVQLPSRLRKGKNTIRFTFTSIAFEQGQHLQFRYKLNGIDTGWVASGHDRAGLYSGLPVGSYQFQVMAANREGDWNPTPATVHFEVLPPLYASAWFQLGCTLFFLGLFYLGARLWEKRRKAGPALRRRIAEDLNQEIGLALATISRMSAEESLKTGRQNFLQRIEQHTAEAKEKLEDLIWLVNPENDAASMFINRISEYAQLKLHPFGINADIRIEKKALRSKIPIEHRKELYLDFKSAVQHLLEEKTPCQVRIIFYQEHQALRFKIQS